MDNLYPNSDFNHINFGPDFSWGITTAAYQVEGAYDVDGKGQSIWDVFTQRKGKIKNSHHGQVACDFYHLYQDDIKLIHDLKIPNFRFSISWSRIFPEGYGQISQAGIDYYNRVIDYALKSGLTPWITLYHWDLPHFLELKGGWTNRDIISWFSDYASLCAKVFGDRVRNWIVMNEPSVFTGAGYFLGIHAPGRKGLKNFLPAMHHATLATSSAARILRSNVDNANIGTAISCTYIEPYTNSKKDVEASKRIDALLNRTFIEPLLGLGYPEMDLPFLRKLDKYIQKQDESLLSFDFDFIGIQNYTREIVRHSFFVPYLKARLVKAEKRKVPLTQMKWEVYPPAIYHMVKKFNAYPQIKKILITENGAAFEDKIIDKRIDDLERTRFLQNNLSYVLKAKKEGCKVDGYFVWTLTDNFEWAEGYHPRFGLVYVDFETQMRTIKNSGLWYRGFLS